MRFPNIRRIIRRGQEEIQVEDKDQSNRVPNPQVGIHQPHRETLGTKEAACLMKYQLAQIVRRSIGASVVGEAGLVMGVLKKGTKLMPVQRRIEYKELERQR